MSKSVFTRLVEKSRCLQFTNLQLQTTLWSRIVSSDGIGLGSLARNRTDTRDGLKKQWRLERGGELP